MSEIWKDIKDFEGLYQVSNLGSVRSLDRLISDKNGHLKKIKGRNLKGSLSDTGYINVSLCKESIIKCINIGPMTLSTFKGHKENMTCNHKNTDKTDNRLVNLEWMTQSENSKHLYENLLNQAQKILLDTNSFVYYYSITEACKYVGLSHKILSDMLNGKRINTTNLVLA
jgi:hypothetical protein